MVWAAGKQLQGGRYVIEKVLGEGGFGITYKALHKLLNQLVVIKTPNQRLKYDPDEYPKYLQRFKEEGQRLARLSEKPHPNIVRVSNLFEEGGTYYLVMDFVPGVSLESLVRRRGALPQEEAIEYVRQIGAALTIVHKANLVHRDAHPGNIMVQNDGKAVLIDFGIAADLALKVNTSKHPANRAFAPPEQEEGSGEPTVDIYTLTASLYYAVTGQFPSWQRQGNKPKLVPPKQFANISDDLNQAILKGMELDARKRPQSVQEWLKLLEVANRAAPAPPPQRTIRRNFNWQALGELVAFFLYNTLMTLSFCIIFDWDWTLNWVAALGIGLILFNTLVWCLASYYFYLHYFQLRFGEIFFMIVLLGNTLWLFGGGR
ncbi:serine/threonine protein kinase [Microcoleus sp. FACHB-831]|uniref:serine/threonine protein kinase n=1 Tax=Microcoleus sp. FACHB-831 TaxID=2692827 RepID=UPI001683387F|nr:serine/threonine-protein kinase [Microcoleus sp. FACHB-831]MBD1920194.1 serine/threonine protein kinase [Microcoleus sp. FACHB-831]